MYEICIFDPGGLLPETDRAAIHGGAAQMRGVSTLEDACAAARELLEQGVGCIGAVRRSPRTARGGSSRPPGTGFEEPPPAGAGGQSSTAPLSHD
ncbi:MAG: hypothetical protein ACLRWQ_01945 [Flavonifractor plautii]